jgi:OOP family OmpA-OmpF porin
MGHDADPAFHFGVGAKAPINHIVSIRLDLRDTLTQKRNQDPGTGANSFDILLGATFTFDRPAPASLVDTDYDGLYDKEDKCPTNGALTADGCPQDSDADGLFDNEDRCPNEFASTTDGCPAVVATPADADGDGIPVPCDMCPDTKGVSPDGCAIKDTDGDGIDDALDKCPKEPETRNGFEDADGCPDQMPEAMKRFTGVMTGIAFDQGKATIRKESHSTLDAAYETLAKYPSIRIEISGHTSSEGSETTNQKLSEDRAAAVRDYLVKKGIPAERVIARGAGPSEPIADNATPAGRQQNRRIEFKIVADP